jgi:hypothetical protein
MPSYFALGPLWKCGGDLPLPAAPSYHTLAIGNGWGLWPDRVDPWNEWRRANGVSLDGGIANCSEAGAAMYRALAGVLRQHPEYQALVAGRLTGPPVFSPKDFQGTSGLTTASPCSEATAKSVRSKVTNSVSNPLSCKSNATAS